MEGTHYKPTKDLGFTCCHPTNDANTTQKHAQNAYSICYLEDFTTWTCTGVFATSSITMSGKSQEQALLVSHVCLKPNPNHPTMVCQPRGPCHHHYRAGLQQ